jgi:SsrA-binding protein
MKVINQKARFDYELGERMEAGIELLGAEVKSTKLGQVDMGNSYVKFRPNKFGKQEAWLLNLMIYPYKHADNKEYIPTRSRRLLLHPKEILELLSKMKQTNRMLVPTAIYTKSNFIKIELALARGKRKYEKREAIKKRDEERSKKAR